MFEIDLLLVLKCSNFKSSEVEGTMLSGKGVDNVVSLNVGIKPVKSSGELAIFILAAWITLQS